jgi:hypothetical protein
MGSTNDQGRPDHLHRRTVRALPSNLDEVRDAWGLTGDAMTAVSRERIYLSANDLETTGS